MADATKTTRFRCWLWLIRAVGVIVPRRLRADWRQEWEAELRHREALLAVWDRLDWRSKLDLLWRSTSAFWDALWLQPKRLEDEMFQDLRFGVRMLLKHKGFTAVAVLTLALGIGANTAIFSLINKILLRPLPAPEPERLVALNNATGKARSFPLFSYLNYKDLRDRSEALSGLLAYTMAPVSLSHAGANERVWGYLVSGNYFETLGVQPALGRLIAPDDDRAPGAHPVAVISHRCFERRFGADPAVVGRNALINGRSFTVIGVAPPQFLGLEINYVPEIWFPLMMQSEITPGREWLNDRKRDNLFLAGRLKPGVSAAQAGSSFKLMAAQLAREHPSENADLAIELSPPGLFGAVGRGPILGFSGVLMGVVGLVLLLVCANLANLLLARALERRREIAVRLALGAGRWRIVRQLLTESLLLALLGGAFGLWLAFWLIQAAGSFRPPMDVPLSTELGLDARVLVFTFGLTLGASVMFGLLPAWQATRPELIAALKDQAAAGSRRSRLRSALVVAQVALSFVLMIGAGLALRGLQRMQDAELGFNPQQAVKLSFDLDLQGYDRERGRQFQRRLLERVRTLPGAHAAGLGNLVPLELYVAVFPVNIEGRPPAREGETPLAGAALVSPGYFQALGARLIAGRDFTEQDDEQSPRVAVVNETFARRFWPGADAIGKRFSLPSRDNAPIQVIGIAQDGKYRSLSEAPQPFVFTSIRQSYAGLTTLVVRTNGGPAQTLAALRHELERLDPHLPVFGAMTLTEHLRLPLFPARVAAAALGGFGALSLTLAAIGLFGVMSYSVGQRTREIGIRMALGARGPDVLRLLIRQGMTVVTLGVALGLAGALALTRLMSSLLFGVSATDPLTFAGVAVLLAGVALVACYLPARRATQVDPLVALRHE
ncbi:MAG: ABC transporter permease [Blastocatellia bacterium]